MEYFFSEIDSTILVEGPHQFTPLQRILQSELRFAKQNDGPGVDEHDDDQDSMHSSDESFDSESTTKEDAVEIMDDAVGYSGEQSFNSSRPVRFQNYSLILALDFSRNSFEVNQNGQVLVDRFPAVVQSFVMTLNSMIYAQKDWAEKMRKKRQKKKRRVSKYEWSKDMLWEPKAVLSVVAVNGPVRRCNETYTTVLPRNVALNADEPTATGFHSIAFAEADSIVPLIHPFRIGDQPKGSLPTLGGDSGSEDIFEEITERIQSYEQSCREILEGSNTEFEWDHLSMLRTFERLSHLVPYKAKQLYSISVISNFSSIGACDNLIAARAFTVPKDINIGIIGVETDIDWESPHIGPLNFALRVIGGFIYCIQSVNGSTWFETIRQASKSMLIKLYPSFPLIQSHFDLRRVEIPEIVPPSISRLEAFTSMVQLQCSNCKQVVLSLAESRLLQGWKIVIETLNGSLNSAFSCIAKIDYLFNRGKLEVWFSAEVRQTQPDAVAVDRKVVVLGSRILVDAFKDAIVQSKVYHASSSEEDTSTSGPDCQTAGRQDDHMIRDIKATLASWMETDLAFLHLLEVPYLVSAVRDPQQKKVLIHEALYSMLSNHSQLIGCTPDFHSKLWIHSFALSYRHSGLDSTLASIGQQEPKRGVSFATDDLVPITSALTISKLVSDAILATDVFLWIPPETLQVRIPKIPTSSPQTAISLFAYKHQKFYEPLTERELKFRSTAVVQIFVEPYVGGTTLAALVDVRISCLHMDGEEQQRVLEKVKSALTNLDKASAITVKDTNPLWISLFHRILEFQGMLAVGSHRKNRLESSGFVKRRGSTLMKANPKRLLQFALPCSDPSDLKRYSQHEFRYQLHSWQRWPVIFYNLIAWRKRNGYSLLHCTVSEGGKFRVVLSKEVAATSSKDSGGAKKVSASTTRILDVIMSMVKPAMDLRRINIVHFNASNSFAQEQSLIQATCERDLQVIEALLTGGLIIQDTIHYLEHPSQRLRDNFLPFDFSTFFQQILLAPHRIMEFSVPVVSSLADVQLKFTNSFTLLVASFLQKSAFVAGKGRRKGFVEEELFSKFEGAEQLLVSFFPLSNIVVPDFDEKKSVIFLVTPQQIASLLPSANPLEMTFPVVLAALSTQLISDALQRSECTEPTSPEKVNSNNFPTTNPLSFLAYEKWLSDLIGLGFCLELFQICQKMHSSNELDVLQSFTTESWDFVLKFMKSYAVQTCNIDFLLRTIVLTTDLAAVDPSDQLQEICQLVTTDLIASKSIVPIPWSDYLYFIASSPANVPLLGYFELELQRLSPEKEVIASYVVENSGQSDVGLAFIRTFNEAAFHADISTLTLFCHIRGVTLSPHSLKLSIGATSKKEFHDFCLQYQLYVPPKIGNSSRLGTQSPPPLAEKIHPGNPVELVGMNVSRLWQKELLAGPHLSCFEEVCSAAVRSPINAVVKGTLCSLALHALKATFSTPSFDELKATIFEQPVPNENDVQRLTYDIPKQLEQNPVFCEVVTQVVHPALCVGCDCQSDPFLRYAFFVNSNSSAFHSPFFSAILKDSKFPLLRVHDGLLLFIHHQQAFTRQWVTITEVEVDDGLTFTIQSFLHPSENTHGSNIVSQLREVITKLVRIVTLCESMLKCGLNRHVTDEDFVPEHWGEQDYQVLKRSPPRSPSPNACRGVEILRLPLYSRLSLRTVASKLMVELKSLRVANRPGCYIFPQETDVFFLFRLVFLPNREQDMQCDPSEFPPVLAEEQWSNPGSLLVHLYYPWRRPNAEALVNQIKYLVNYITLLDLMKSSVEGKKTVVFSEEEQKYLEDTCLQDQDVSISNNSQVAKELIFANLGFSGNIVIKMDAAEASDKDAVLRYLQPPPAGSDLSTIFSAAIDFSSFDEKKVRVTIWNSIRTHKKVEARDDKFIQGLMASVKDTDVCLDFGKMIEEQSDVLHHQQKKEGGGGVNKEEHLRILSKLPDMFRKWFNHASRTTESSFLLREGVLQSPTPIAPSVMPWVIEQLLHALNAVEPALLAVSNNRVNPWKSLRNVDWEEVQSGNTQDFYIVCGVKLYDENQEVLCTKNCSLQLSPSMTQQDATINNAAFLSQYPKLLVLRFNAHYIRWIVFNMKVHSVLSGVFRGILTEAWNRSQLLNDVLLQRLGFYVPTSFVKADVVKSLEISSTSSSASISQSIELHDIISHEGTCLFTTVRVSETTPPTLQQLAQGLATRGKLSSKFTFARKDGLLVLTRDFDMPMQVAERIVGELDNVGGEYYLPGVVTSPERVMIFNDFDRHLKMAFRLLQSKSATSRFKTVIRNFLEGWNGEKTEEVLHSLVTLQCKTKLYYASRVPDFNLRGRQAQVHEFPGFQEGGQILPSSPGGEKFKVSIDEILDEYVSNLEAMDESLTCFRYDPPPVVSTGNDDLDERIRCRFGLVVQDENAIRFTPKIFFLTKVIKIGKQIGMFIFEIGLSIENFALDMFVVRGSIPSNVIMGIASRFKLDLSFSSQMYDLSVRKLLSSVSSHTKTQKGEQLWDANAANLCQYYPRPPNHSVNSIRCYRMYSESCNRSFSGRAPSIPAQTVAFVDAPSSLPRYVMQHSGDTYDYCGLVGWFGDELIIYVLMARINKKKVVKRPPERPAETREILSQASAELFQVLLKRYEDQSVKQEAEASWNMIRLVAEGVGLEDVRRVRRCCVRIPFETALSATMPQQLGINWFQLLSTYFADVTGKIPHGLFTRLFINHHDQLVHLFLFKESESRFAALVTASGVSGKVEEVAIYRLTIGLSDAPLLSPNDSERYLMNQLLRILLQALWSQTM